MAHGPWPIGTGMALWGLNATLSSLRCFCWQDAAVFGWSHTPAGHCDTQFSRYRTYVTHVAYEAYISYRTRLTMDGGADDGFTGEELNRKKE